MRRRDAGRRGFTTLEILVVLAVLAILAAVVGRSVVGSVNSGRSAGLAESLAALRDGVFRYREDVRRWPTNLSYLSAQPVAATDLCGRTVPPGFLNGWSGPYAARTITASGIPVGDAVIQDALEPSVVFGIETTGTLSIVVTEVDSVVAARLEVANDGAVAAGVYGTGVIRWTDTAPAGDHRGTLRYGLAIRGC